MSTKITQGDKLRNSESGSDIVVPVLHCNQAHKSAYSIRKPSPAVIFSSTQSSHCNGLRGAPRVE
ncbi:hypothetical protein M413DRAFT_448707 [Hebeloma cylindrosporum]|uniref:Uncharacterized protein n=1 Tax=Hebeloma cylindrosporum TaxID=76867 RepID=A0A0C2Y882_HEBCY|nr:hypothetical protein M413DRAFT_448707 [Hebeloma cylindrosporum h7]